MSLPSSAAQNCISNGDFELPDGAYKNSSQYSYNSQTGGTPTGWSLSPNNRTGLVDEGTTRYGVLDLMGTHSLFLERRKADTSSTFAEAKQTFAIPAPGIYRLRLDCCSWSPDNTQYLHAKANAQLILPGGATTNSLNSFNSRSFNGGLEGIVSFMSDTSVLSAHGAGNDYTLRFYASDTTDADYAYKVIDNVSFSLRTLVLGSGETFTTPLGLDPHDMALGANATLTYAPTTATAEIVPGAVTLASGAKIVFDMADATANAYVLRTGGFSLPSGASDPLAFIEIANAGDYSVSLIEDGTTVLVSKSGATLSAMWTGGGDASSLLDADNWSAVPDASTLYISLGAAADWRGLSALSVSPAATIDMNGHALSLSGLSSSEFTGAAITNSASGSAATLTVEVAAGATNVNDSIALLGNIRLVKSGAGVFKASAKGQTYSGGTEVAAGTLAAGIHGKYRPFGAAENLVVNGDFEATGLPDTNIYAAVSGKAPGWTIPTTTDSYVFNAHYYWSLDSHKYREPQYEFDKWALALGNGSSTKSRRTAEQTFHVGDTGIYRLSFEYGTWMSAGDYDPAPTDVTVTGGGETLLSATVTPVAEVGYRQFFADVEIAEAGDFTLKFDVSTTGRYFIVDNVSFAKKCTIEVGNGATFDVNGREGSGLYSAAVAGGGTIQNGGSAMSADKIGFPDVSLSGDAALRLTKSYALSGYDGATAVLDLGGNTLSATVASGESLVVSDAAITDGTFAVAGPGWLRFLGDTDASSASLAVAAPMEVAVDVAVLDYAANYTGKSNSGTAALSVLGTFTPGTAYFYGCTMEDGATIDLSAKSAAWQTTSSSNGKNTIEFAPAATVNIEVGDRVLAAGDKVVSWTAKPDLDDDVGFALTSGGTVSETLALAAKDDGLYVKNAAEPLYATWDVATSAWKFYGDDDGEVSGWSGGVTDNMQVRFSSWAEYAAIVAADVSPNAYVMTTNSLVLPSGEGDLDMSAVAFEFTADATIDLNGRTLALPEAMVGGTKPFTVTSSATGGVLVANVTGDAVNTAMTLTGDLKLLKAGAGTLTASKTGQTYTGGTEVTNGVLKCGVAGWVSGDGDTLLFGVPKELVANGDFDADTSASWHGATGWSASPDNWCGRQAAGSYSSASLPVGKFAMIAGSQSKGGTAAQFWQDVEISSPGRYRYSFDHARRNASYSLETDVVLIHDGVEQTLATVTPTTVDTFTHADGDVEVAEAGTYTLKFRLHQTPSSETASYYNIFDNVSFVRLAEVRATGAAAAIDMNGKLFFYDYQFALDGGVLKNSGSDASTTASKIQWARLESDSTLQIDRNYGFHGSGGGHGEIALGGHAMTIDIADGKTFRVVNMTIDDGRIDVPATTGTLVFGSSSVTNEIVATNVDFAIGSALNVAAPVSVRSYEAKYEGSGNAGTAALNVYGTFRPVASNHYGCVMHGGTTLDLSGWTGAWPWSVVSEAGGGSNTVAFAEGAEISVKFGDLHPTGRVVAWPNAARPPESVVFRRAADDTRQYALRLEDDGLYITRGFLMIVR